MTYKNKKKSKKEVLRSKIIDRMVKAAQHETQKELAGELGITPPQINSFITRVDGTFYKRIVRFAENHNKSIDWLMTGEETYVAITKEKAGATIETGAEYELSEDAYLVEKLREILKHSDQGEKNLVINVINVICGERYWIKGDRKERRKKLIPLPGQTERRLKIHGY